jgi:DNA-directed RNA polymerase specialized sigma subunit
MTTQEVKEILNEARKAGIRYIKARNRYRELERKLTGGKSVRFNSTGAQYEHNGNAVENAYCELSDREDKMNSCREDLSRPYRTAGRLIYLVEDAKKRQVLNMYYLYCKSWEQIAEELNVSVRQVHRLHGYAFKEISRKA